MQHDDSHPAGVALCNLLYEQLKQEVPSIQRQTTEDLKCGLLAVGRNRFAYVNHRKTTPNVQIYFRAIRDVIPTTSPSILVKTRTKFTTAWEREFPHYLDVTEREQIPSVADLLLGTAYPLSEKSVRGKSSRGGSHDGTVSIFPADDEQEEIRRVNRLIVARQQQGPFRDALIEAYERKCAVTGWTAVAVLEAAHIRPHSVHGPSIVTNGLLLRSDIHTLFDLGYLRIHPDSLRVILKSDLRGTDYGQYHDISISVPDDSANHPSRAYLRHRWTMNLSRIREPIRG